ncbi:pyridoxal 5'-phosphate synthase glutaminase subunit PdxT, partial [Aestuariivirga sp.]|uniref:pyridoxal 5'-phosphate synthase glutaminase subunit PdxT n=1 Tax=Aestuariivirga sp. TaxID=2650926 RepID=UPI003018F454
VLAIQGAVREHVALLEAAGAQAIQIRHASDIAEVDGIVLPGGESTTISKLAVIDGLMEPLRAAASGGVPMYGSCAGMILLADRILDGRPDQETIGGIDMTVRRNAFGRQVDSFEGGIDLEGIPGGPFPGIFIRAPWVEELGEQVEVLGRVGNGAALGRIVAVRDRNLIATSFHPELTGDIRVHQYFVEMVRQTA